MRWESIGYWLTALLTGALLMAAVNLGGGAA